MDGFLFFVGKEGDRKLLRILKATGDYDHRGASPNVHPLKNAKTGAAFGSLSTICRFPYKIITGIFKKNILDKDFSFIV